MVHMVPPRSWAGALRLGDRFPLSAVSVQGSPRLANQTTNVAKGSPSRVGCVARAEGAAVSAPEAVCTLAVLVFRRVRHECAQITYGTVLNAVNQHFVCELRGRSRLSRGRV
jgi:hypothetical protein